MGVDFIRRAAPTFKKSWNNGAKGLAQGTLFTRYPECRGRTVAADMAACSQIDVGKNVVIQIVNGEMCLTEGLSMIGKIPSPPADLLKIIGEVGCAKGTVERVNTIGGTADVAIQ